MSESPSLRRFTVDPSENGRDLLSVLKTRLDLGTNKTKRILDERRVWVNDRRIWMARHALRRGDRIEVRGAGPASPRASESAPIPVLYRDGWIVAVNKPAGRVSDRRADSVEARLRLQLDLPDLRALHRLDRETTGVLLFTLRAEDRPPYVDLFREQQVEKRYEALLAGHLPRRDVTVRQRLDGKEAETRFRARRAAPGACRVDCWIQTGRTHQIRRHAAHLDCRVLGDTRYPQGPPPARGEKTLSRHMLHAAELSLPCPHTGARLVLQAPLPEDFREAARRFGID